MRSARWQVGDTIGDVGCGGGGAIRGNEVGKVQFENSPTAQDVQQASSFLKSLKFRE